MKRKVSLPGWNGPWGWKPAFEEYARDRLEFVSVAEAHVVFQTDPTNYDLTIKEIRKDATLICNVLDFAEWTHDGQLSPQMLTYVNSMRSAGAQFTAISDKVRDQLATNFGIKAGTFIYPSQVTYDFINQYSHFESKVKVPGFFSCGRLADPGKRIPEAVSTWLATIENYRAHPYMFRGPEVPNIDLKLPGIVYQGLTTAENVVGAMAMMKAVIQASDGEGLGLPAIEAMLVGTLPIMRRDRPMTDLFKDYPFMFDDWAELGEHMLAILDLSDDEYSELIAEFQRPILLNYIREEAFKLLAQDLESIR